MNRLGFLLAAMLAVFPTFAASGGHVPSPEEAFGFPLGADRRPADWTQLVSYFQALGAASDRIHLEELGQTTEGRPYVALTISAPENLAHLAEYKAITQKLSDARATTPEEAAKLIDRGKMILVVTCNIHSTEIASSQRRTTRTRSRSCAISSWCWCRHSTPTACNW